MRLRRPQRHTGPQVQSGAFPEVADQNGALRERRSDRRWEPPDRAAGLLGRRSEQVVAVGALLEDHLLVVGGMDADGVRFTEQTETDDGDAAVDRLKAGLAGR